MSRRTRNLLAVVASFAIAVTGVYLLPSAADAATKTLPGGTVLTNTITAPANNSTTGASGNVTLTGNATVGDTPTDPNATFIYVVDRSGSTTQNPGSGCGGNENPSADSLSKTILDCEILAGITLNSQAASSGVVGKAGVVSFGGDSTAVLAPVAPSSASVATALRSIGVTSSGNTNFEAGVKAACTMAGTVNQTTVVFMSDGMANLGGSATAAAAACGNNVSFRTFAIGSGSSCTDTGTGNQGSLEQIAQSKDPKSHCVAVTDLSTLPTIVSALAAAKVDSVTGTDNGNPAAAGALVVTNAGTASASYTWNLTGLAPGSTHTLCTTATGTDYNGSGSATECRTVTVPVTKPNASIDDQTVAENAGPAVFHVTLDKPAPAGGTTCHFATSDYTAVAGVDYTATSGDLFIAEGATSGTISVTILDNNTYGPVSKSFAVILSPPCNATIVKGTGVGTITDNETPPTVSLVGTASGTSGVSIPEGDTGTTPVPLTVKLDHPSSSPITVHFVTGAPGTATGGGVDYNATTGSVTIPAGATSVALTPAPTVVGDYLDEPNETFTVKLDGTSAGSTIGAGTATVTIIDDDRNGSFSCQATGLRLLGLSTYLANGSYSPCMDSTGSLLALQVSSLVTVDLKVLGASTDATPNDAVKTKPAVGDQGKGDSSVANVAIALGGHTITADAVKSHAEAACQAPLGGTPKLSASTVLTNVKIDGKPVVLVNGSAYVELNVLGLVGVKVWINRTISTATDITQRAIQVTGTGLLSAVDVVVAEARAGFTGNPCSS